MLVESAAIYSVFGIIFIGTYFRQNPVNNLVLPILGTLEVCTLLLSTPHEQRSYLLDLGYLSTYDHLPSRERERMDKQNHPTAIDGTYYPGPRSESRQSFDYYYYQILGQYEFNERFCVWR